MALLAIALLAGFFTQDIMAWFTSSTPITLEEHCQLSTTACEQNNAVITISQDTAQPLLPFSLQANWPQSDASQLNLTLQGHEMEMGTARFAIAKLADGQYQGEVLLPACTMENMTWVGTLSDGKQSINVAIRMAR